MYVYDTNIFLEILLGQSNAQVSQDALALMNEDRAGIVSSFSLHAIEAIVSGAGKPIVLQEFLEFVDTHPFLNRYATTFDEELEIAKLSSRIGLDFDDALQYHVAQKLGFTLITFDKHFKKTPGIKVIFPT